MKSERSSLTDEQIGMCIRARRNELGITVEEFADRLAISGMRLHPSSVTRIELGTRSVRLREAPDIAAALGLDTARLLGEGLTASAALAQYESERLALAEEYAERKQQLKRKYLLNGRGAA